MKSLEERLELLTLSAEMDDSTIAERQCKADELASCEEELALFVRHQELEEQVDALNDELDAVRGKGKKPQAKRAALEQQIEALEAELEAMELDMLGEEEGEEGEEEEGEEGEGASGAMGMEEEEEEFEFPMPAAAPAPAPAQTVAQTVGGDLEHTDINVDDSNETIVHEGTAESEMLATTDPRWCPKGWTVQLQSKGSSNKRKSITTDRVFMFAGVHVVETVQAAKAESGWNERHKKKRKL